MRARWWAGLALGAYGLILLGLTVGWAGSGRGGALRLVPFETIALAWRMGGVALLVNIIGNIVAFVPLGWLAPILWAPARSWIAVGALGCGVSLGIECAQWLRASRVSDIDDIILNTLGALAGYGLCRGLRRRSSRPAFVEYN